MRAPEIVDEVMRDIDFYCNSGGGITVSGGEPLSQVEFVVHLLESCKKEGLHTALDTTGYAPWEKIERVLTMVDLVLFDIKHLDPDEHKRTTGVGNDLIFENLEKASHMTSVWLRIPLIADFNDSPEHIRRIAALGKDTGVEKISLLSYHEGGESKARQLGKVYQLSDGRAASDEHVRNLIEIIRREGVQASIGN